MHAVRALTPLLAARLATVAGMLLYIVVVAWVAVDTTGSSLHGGLLTGVFLLPGVLIALSGGAFVDRYCRKTILQWTCFVRAMAFAGVALVALCGVDHLAVLYIATGISGVCFALETPAGGAFLGENAERSGIPHGRANGLWHAAAKTGGVVGTGAGALLLLVMPPLQALWLASAFQLAACWALSRMRPRNVISNVGYNPLPTFSALGETWRFLRTKSTLLTVVLIAALPMSFVQALNVLMAPFVREEWHGSGSAYGLLSAVGAVGAGIAALFCVRYPDPANSIASHAITHFALAAIVLMFVLTTTLSSAAVVVAFLCCFMTLGNIFHPAYIQEKTPNQHLGRVLGFVQFASSVFSLIFAVGAGLLGHFMPLKVAFGIWSGVFLLSALILAYRARQPVLSLPVPAPQQVL